MRRAMRSTMESVSNGVRLVGPWVVRDVRARYRQTRIRTVWIVAAPAGTAVAYGFAFSQLFEVSTGSMPYVSFVWCGVALWTFFAAAVLGGAWSLVESADLVRRLPFAHAIAPASSVVTCALDLFVSLIVLAVIMTVQGVGTTVVALYGLASLTILLAWTLALAVSLAFAAAWSRDAVHACSLALRIGIFATPVLYPVEQIPEGYQWIVSVNPVAVSIDSFRAAVLGGVRPDVRLLGLHLALGFVAIGAALALAGRLRGRIADVI